MLKHADGDLARLRAVLVLDEDTVASTVLTVDPFNGDGDLRTPHFHAVAVKEGDRLVILQPRDFRGGVSRDDTGQAQGLLERTGRECSVSPPYNHTWHSPSLPQTAPTTSRSWGYIITCVLL